MQTPLENQKGKPRNISMKFVLGLSMKQNGKMQ